MELHGARQTRATISGHRRLNEVQVIAMFFSATPMVGCFPVSQRAKLRTNIADRDLEKGKKQYSSDKATFRMTIKRTASVVKRGAIFVCREYFVLFTSRSLPKWWNCRQDAEQRGHLIFWYFVGTVKPCLASTMSSL